MEPRKLFWMTLLAGLFCSAGISWYLSQRPEAAQASRDEVLVPDIILSGLSQLNFADDGLKHYSVDARQALNYSKRGMTEFDTPQMVFFEQNEHRWDARANNGITRDNGNTFNLRGDVVIRRLSPDRDPIELHTDNIDISSHEERVNTDARVTLIQGPNRTESEGLRVDMQTGKLSLRHVSSRYHPPSS